MVLADDIHFCLSQPKWSQSDLQKPGTWARNIGPGEGESERGQGRKDRKTQMYTSGFASSVNVNLKHRDRDRGLGDQWWPGWFCHSCQQVWKRVPSGLILVWSCAWKPSSSVLLIGPWKLMTYLFIWVQVTLGMIRRHRPQLTWAAVENVSQQVALHCVSKQPPLMWKWVLTCCSSGWKFSLRWAPGQHALEFKESRPASKQGVQACQAEGKEGDPAKGRCSASLWSTRTQSLHLLMPS